MGGCLKNPTSVRTPQSKTLLEQKKINMITEEAAQGKEKTAVALFPHTMNKWIRFPNTPYLKGQVS